MGSVDHGTKTKARMGLKGSLSVICGTLLLVFSFLHLVATITGPVGFMKVINIPPDPIIGAVMFQSSILLLIGGYKIILGEEDGPAFAWVGWFIGILIFTISILMLMSNLIRVFFLATADMDEWSLRNDIVPGLYLGIMFIVLVPALLSRKVRKRVGGEEK